jgi:hypothetical protein
MFGDDSTELFDAQTESWVRARPMAERRNGHALVALADGRALAIGGHWKNIPTASCELFDPATRTWSVAVPLPEPRHSHAAVVTGDRVLVVGGNGIARQLNGRFALDSVVAWSPGDAKWTTLPSTPRAHELPRAVALADGSVLVTGGSEVDRWDPRTGSWTQIGVKRYHSALIALPGGGAAAIGGLEKQQASSAVSIWDPRDGWRDGAPLAAPRCSLRAIALVDGRIVLVGGFRTEQKWEDTSTGGELDYEYRSFMHVVTHHIPHEDIVIGDPRTGWSTAAAPAIGSPEAVLVPRDPDAWRVDDERILVLDSGRSLLWAATRS